MGFLIKLATINTLLSICLLVGGIFLSPPPSPGQIQRGIFSLGLNVLIMMLVVIDPPLVQTDAATKKKSGRDYLTRLFSRFLGRRTTPSLPLSLSSSPNTLILKSTAPHTPTGPIPYLQDNEPEWIAQRRLNLANSPLCRLPTELLLIIKSYLSPGTIFILCHTSALFFPLLDRARLDNLSKLYIPMRSNMFDNDADRVEVCNLLRGEFFCRPCNERQRKGLLKANLQHLQEPLYCTGYSSEHPAFLFPADQRAKKRTDPRVCYGRIGHIQVCSHMTISWSDVEKIGQGVIPQGQGKSTSSNCRKSICMDRSHQPPKNQWCNKHPQYYFDRPWLYPTIVMSRERYDNQNLVQVNITSEIPLFDIKDQGPSRHPTRRELEAALRRAVAGQLFGHRFCPHVSPSTPDSHSDNTSINPNSEKLLRAFSSNICACFPALASSPHDPSHIETCCLCVSYPSHRADGGDVEEQEVKEVSHGFLPNHLPHYFFCSRCQAVYVWRRLGQRVYIALYWTLILHKSPAASYWLESLAPESLGIGGPDRPADQDLWCETKRCVTNKRWMSMVKRYHGMGTPGW